MSIKDMVNGNMKWLRYGSLIIALIIFVLAQGQSNGTKAEGIKNNKEDIIDVKQELKELKDFNLIQSERMVRLESNSDNIKEDVKDIKKDNKEILRILYKIKDD